MTRIRLPRADGSLHDYTLRAPRTWRAGSDQRNRIAYAAAHVVADPFAGADPWLQPAIDWDATLAYRSYLWSLGFGVAEAQSVWLTGPGRFHHPHAGFAGDLRGAVAARIRHHYDVQFARLRASQ